MKHCNRCNSNKASEEFYRNTGKSDGLDAWCKACRREVDHAYYKRTRGSKTKSEPEQLDTKRCRKCDIVKSREEFRDSRSYKDGKYGYCIECTDAYLHERRVRFYGLTGKQMYDNMLEGQGGGCYACGKTPQDNGRRLAIDHCHASGKVRALLCDKCNRALGLVQDNTNTLKKLIQLLND